MFPQSISPTDLSWASDAHPLRRAQGATFCGRNTVRQRALGSGHTQCACVLGMMSEYSMHEGSSPCGRCGSRRGLGVRCCERNQSRHVPLAGTACHCAGSLGSGHIVLCSLLRHSFGDSRETHAAALGGYERAWVSAGNVMFRSLLVPLTARGGGAAVT